MWRVVQRNANRPPLYLHVPRDEHSVLCWVLALGAATTFADKDTALYYAKRFQRLHIHAKVERIGTHATTLQSPSSLDGRSRAYERRIRGRLAKGRPRVRPQGEPHFKETSGEGPEEGR